jgi:hypothetical protein
MNIDEHIAYHEDKIERIHAEIEEKTKTVAKYAKGGMARSEDLLALGHAIAKLESDARVSIETRMTLINVRGEQDAEAFCG